jgi:hypothetical protein
MSGSSVSVSRRPMISLASVLFLSGCAESFEDRVAKDPYISLIKQDPMFAWVPPGNLHRDVSYSPATAQPMASQWSAPLSYTRSQMPAPFLP